MRPSRSESSTSNADRRPGDGPAASGVVGSRREGHMVMVAERERERDERELD